MKMLKNYYTIITKVECPKIIIIGFELSLPEDLYNSKNELNSVEAMNILSFDRLKIILKLLKLFQLMNLQFIIQIIV